MIEQLSAYLDNELTPAERAEVEAFLEGDAEARAVLSELRATSQAVHALPRVRASDRLLDEVRARMERDALLGNMGGKSRAVPRESPRSLRWLAVAAVLALSGTSLYMVTSWSDSDRPGVMLTEAKRERPGIVPSAQPEAVERRGGVEDKAYRSRPLSSPGTQEDLPGPSSLELVDASVHREGMAITAAPADSFAMGGVVADGAEHEPVAAVVDVTYPDVETQSRAVEMLRNNFAFATADVDVLPVVADADEREDRPAETRASGRPAARPAAPVAGNLVAPPAAAARFANQSREVALVRAVPSKALNQTLKEVQDQGGFANVRVVNRGEYVRLASNVSNTASFGVSAAASRPREAHYYLYGIAGAGNQLDVREVQQVLAQVAPTQNVLNVQPAAPGGEGQSGSSHVSYGAHAVADATPTGARSQTGGAGGSLASPARAAAGAGGVGGGGMYAEQAEAPPPAAIDPAMARSKAALSEPQPAPASEALAFDARVSKKPASEVRAANTPASEAPASLPAVTEATSVDRNWAMNESAKQRSPESPALRRVAPAPAVPRVAANRAIDASSMADGDTARAGSATLPAGGAASQPAQAGSPQGGVLTLNMAPDLPDSATGTSQPAITETLSMGHPLRQAARSQPSDEAVVLVYLRVAPATQPAGTAPTP